MTQIYKASTGSGPPTGAVLTLAGNDSVLVPPNSSGTIFLVGAPGSGITVTGNAGTNTETINLTSAGFTWVIQTTSTPAVAGFGYFADGATGPTGITITLPTVSKLGDTFIVYNFNGNGFEIAQGAGQFIQVGQQSTTAGVTGNIISTKIGDTIELVCSIANTQWQAVDYDGNFIIN